MLVRSVAQSWVRQNKGVDNDFVVKLEKDPSAPRHAQDQRIRDCLANQSCVIVQECLEGPESFSKAEIGADMGPLSKIVQWSGRYTWLSRF
jgi:hypothetical protein